jgi:hypothetical protein
MFLPAYTCMLLDMHKQEPFTGTFLTIGRQTVPFTLSAAWNFLKDVGIEATQDIAVESDDTVASKPGWINDRTFFKMFCSAKIESLDVSSYERASIIHNMNEPIPRKLRGIADFIFEGSSIDNIFNPAQAMMNIDLMLKPGGRIFMVNAGNVVPGDTFVALGEEWYEGFLKANNYKGISVETWAYDKVDDPVWRKGREGKGCCVVVKARKQSTWLGLKPVQPIQYGYDIQHHPHRHYLNSLARRVRARVSAAAPRVNRWLSFSS